MLCVLKCCLEMHISTVGLEEIHGRLRPEAIYILAVQPNISKVRYHSCHKDVLRLERSNVDGNFLEVWSQSLRIYLPKRKLPFSMKGTFSLD